MHKQLKPRTWLRSTAAAGAVAGLAVTLALPVAAKTDESSGAMSDVNMAKNNAESGPNNDFYWWSVKKFEGQKLMSTDGETLGTIEKVVMDTRENRGEATVALTEGQTIVLPLREFRVMDGMLVPEQDLTASNQIDELAANYHAESDGGYWEEASDSDMIGKYVYPGNKDYIEQLMKSTQA